MTLPANAKPLGFIITRDRERAKAFYVGTLGGTVLGEDQFAAVIDCGGLKVRLTTVPNHAPAPHTVLGWETTDVVAGVHALRAKGVTFNIYEGFGQDELGIWTAPGGAAQVAWFSDPDGNVLSLSTP